MGTRGIDKSGWLYLLALIAGLFCFTTAAKADDQADPPSRVARISYIDGNVSFQPTGTEDWAAAAKNRPVTIGDKIWSDKDSRVELQAGQAAFHIGSMTAFSFLNLDEGITQVRVAEGAVNFRVRELREGDLYEVDTPNLAFTVKEAGAFRVDVDESGENTRVTVIRGEGEVTAGGHTYEIHAGDQAELNGTDEPEYHVSRAPEPDDLDRWAADRDLKEEHSVSARYVSRDVPGYEDLDDYGTWDEVPEYGHVWYPTTVAVGWAPYSWGYWNWVGPWGWTWVDYAPWGFAPFHYGRWAYIGSRWGWCPGPVYARPFYGPAFVGFIGGAHWGVGFGFGGGWGGGVGWFPLGWGEPFHPWYHTSSVYLRNVNITNTRIANINVINSRNNFNYAYARNYRAVSAASREAFVNGQAINRANMHITAASLRGAQVTNNVNLRPGRASYVGTANARAHVSMPPARVQDRAVMARTAPARAAVSGRNPVRTMNTAGLTPARGNVRTSGNVRMNNEGGRGANGNFGTRGNAQANSNLGMSSRQRELSNNRPPSAGSGVNGRGSAAVNTNPSRPATGSRNWGAQGSTTDRGRAPQGFGGNSNRPAGAMDRPMQQAPHASQTDRPAWARSDARGSAQVRGTSSPANGNRPSSAGRSYEPPSHAPSVNGGNNRPSYPSQNRSYAAPAPRSYNNSRPSSSPSYGAGRSQDAPSRSYSAPSRSYSAPSRSYSAPSRSYSAPSRSYSAPSYSAPSRSYSAPSRSYSAPSRSYSAPSGGRGYSGGGGSRGGGGGSVSHGGGGSRGGGGGSHGSSRGH
jgi:FecR protein